MATKIEYAYPVGELPIVKCACGCDDFIQHEREPGHRLILECVSCRALTAVNVVAFYSAIRTLSQDDPEWAELSKRNIEPVG
jgi:hypothetical protein